MKKDVAIVVFVLIGFTCQLTTSMPAARADDVCITVPAGQTVQQALNSSATCVQLASQTYYLDWPLYVPSNKTLRGTGSDTVISPSNDAVWTRPNYASVAVIEQQHPDYSNPGIGSSNATISNLVIDGRKNINGTIGAAAGAILSGTTMLNVEVRNARCVGVSILGAGVVLSGVTITRNGVAPSVFQSQCESQYQQNPPKYAPGRAGVYMQFSSDLAQNRSMNPQIVFTTITYNEGPGIDNNGVWNGVLDHSYVAGNTLWAEVSMFGASGWTISNNQIYGVSTNSVAPQSDVHPQCVNGPASSTWNGSYAMHPAGLLLCYYSDSLSVTQGNTVRNNHIASFYGIVSSGEKIGGSYYLPVYNTFLDNNVNGSWVGCVDRAAVGMNNWNANQSPYGCNNNGVSNPVTYFP